MSKKKKNWKKRILPAVVTAVLLASCVLPIMAASDKYTNLLVLGDSISTGYGLPGDVSTRQNYSNLLAKKIAADSVKNYAVDGATSSDLLSLLTANAKLLQDKDLILMSIGGNDLIGATFEVLNRGLKLNITSLESLILDLMMVPTETLEAVFSSQETIARYASMLEQLSENLDSIFSAIKNQNDSAKIVILNQYNPFSGMGSGTNFRVIEKEMDAVILQLNATIVQASQKAGVEVCDVYKAFDGQGGTYTRIFSKDIHPNEAGHALICELLYDLLMAKNPDTGDALPLWTGLMLASAVGVGFFMRKSKKGTQRNRG